MFTPLEFAFGNQPDAEAWKLAFSSRFWVSGETLIANAADEDALLAPVTVTWNEKLPDADGTPETVPDGDRDNPGGAAPEVIDHVYGVDPPVAVRVVK
jgi:hypothetical protein